MSKVVVDIRDIYHDNDSGAAESCWFTTYGHVQLAQQQSTFSFYDLLHAISHTVSVDRDSDESRVWVLTNPSHRLNLNRYYCCCCYCDASCLRIFYSSLLHVEPVSLCTLLFLQRTTMMMIRLLLRHVLAIVPIRSRHNNNFLP